MSKKALLIGGIILVLLLLVLAVLFRDQLFTQVGLVGSLSPTEISVPQGESLFTGTLPDGFVFSGSLSEYRVRAVNVRDSVTLDAQFEADGIVRQYACFGIADLDHITVSGDSQGGTPDPHDIDFYANQLLAAAFSVVAVSSDGSITVRFPDNSHIYCELTGDVTPSPTPTDLLPQ